MVVILIVLTIVGLSLMVLLPLLFRVADEVISSVIQAAGDLNFKDR